MFDKKTKTKKTKKIQPESSYDVLIKEKECILVPLITKICVYIYIHPPTHPPLPANPSVSPPLSLLPYKIHIIPIKNTLKTI